MLFRPDQYTRDGLSSERSGNIRRDMRDKPYIRRIQSYIQSGGVRGADRGGTGSGGSRCSNGLQGYRGHGSGTFVVVGANGVGVYEEVGCSKL